MIVVWINDGWVDGWMNDDWMGGWSPGLCSCFWSMRFLLEVDVRGEGGGGR